MSLRRRGKILSILKIMGILLLGMVIGASAGLGFHIYKMASVEKVKPVVKQTVITVSRPVDLGEVITEEDVIEMEMPEESVPLGSFTQKEEVLGKKAWTRLEPKIILNQDLFYKENIAFMQNIQEVQLIKLPENLEVGDYIDLRIQFPSGHDYCVLSHKQVGSKNIEQNQITVALNEEERVRFGSAKTDASTYDNTYLYLSIYPKGVEMPNTVVRYPVSGSVQKLYEEVTGSVIVGQERNQLELALNQLKEEAKFLKLVSEKNTAASQGKVDTEDNNLLGKEAPQEAAKEKSGDALKEESAKKSDKAAESNEKREEKTKAVESKDDSAKESLKSGNEF